MKLSTTERDILAVLLEKYREDPSEGRSLEPAADNASEFERGLKRLDRNGFLEIEERYGANGAVVRLTQRGEQLCREEAVGDAETRTVEIPVIPTWDEPPDRDRFRRYDDLEPGERFEDRAGHVWEVPRQVDNPDGIREILNRTAIDYHRRTSGIVPAGTFVRPTDDDDQSATHPASP